MGIIRKKCDNWLQRGGVVSESFLVWHRSREYDKDAEAPKYREGRHNQRSVQTSVVACRYWYELTDGYWGQFTLTQLPHLYPKQLLPVTFKHIDSMKNFVGMIEYLMTWKWGTEAGIVDASEGCRFSIECMPICVGDDGALLRVGSEYSAGGAVFGSDWEAFQYIRSVATRDLQYRGFRDDRIFCFEQKQLVNYLLYQKH